MRLALHRAHGRLLFTESAAGLEDDHEHRVLGLDGALMSYVLILLVFSAAIAERFKLPASTAAIIIGAGFGAIWSIFMLIAMGLGGTFVLRKARRVALAPARSSRARF